MSKNSVISPNCLFPFISQPRNKPLPSCLCSNPPWALLTQLPDHAHSTAGMGLCWR